MRLSEEHTRACQKLSIPLATPTMVVAHLQPTTSTYVYAACVKANTSLFSFRAFFVRTYKALRSAGNSAARYARSQARIEQIANQADREVHDFRCKLTTWQLPRAPCSRTTIRTPHACTQCLEKRTETKSSVASSVIEIETRGKSSAHHTIAV